MIPEKKIYRLKQFARVEAYHVDAELYAEMMKPGAELPEGITIEDWARAGEESRMEPTIVHNPQPGQKHGNRSCISNDCWVLKCLDTGEMMVFYVYAGDEHEPDRFLADYEEEEQP